MHTLALEDDLAVKVLVAKPDELSSIHKPHKAKRGMTRGAVL